MKKALLCVVLLSACTPSDGDQSIEMPSQAAEPMAEVAPTVLPDPEKLKGLSPAAVQALMGVPDLVHRADHAQTMLFRGDSCVLDLYFYEQVRGGGFALKWYEARDFKGAAFDAPLCVQSLLAEGQVL